MFSPAADANRAASRVEPPEGARTLDGGDLAERPFARWLRVGELALMMGALVGVGTQSWQGYLATLEQPGAWSGIKVGGVAVDGLAGSELHAAIEAAALVRLDQPLTLHAGTSQVKTSARALGLRPDPDAAAKAALVHGKRGALLSDLAERAAAARGEVDLTVGASFDDEIALAELLALAPALDRPSLPTRLDFDGRRVLAAERGSALLAWDSLSNVAIGLARGDADIELAVHAKPPVDDPLAAVADTLDISTVVGTFSTPYHNDQEHADRNHNLKMGAAAVDGTILMPGDTFSFNDRVGDRSIERGYRWASGITAGELIDTTGGGICQISSTLFGAAFFAGLPIVEQRPHSRPSAYVDMGLDSTVVYPTVDLKFRNDFDFPIVLHMTVNHGKVEAEILGARRPYQVAFERSLDEVTPFQTIVRNDPNIRVGHQTVSQRGMRGFKLTRTRRIYSAGKELVAEPVELKYPATTEIVRQGTSPDGEIVENTAAPKLRDPAPSLRITQ